MTFGKRRWEEGHTRNYPAPRILPEMSRKEIDEEMEEVVLICYVCRS